jgi:cytochrome c5
MRIALMTVVILIALLVGAGVAVIYSGVYDVAATSNDPALIRWVLRTTTTRSVECRAREVQLPADLSFSDPNVIDLGFEHYNEMCTICHGAPVVQPGEAHDGLNPKPSNLAEHAKERSPQELFWIIKNGIKLTGMPAWGPTHSDAKIWAMVAFVKALPGITPNVYRAMQARAAQSGDANKDHAGDGTRAHEDDSEHRDHSH